jgi:predicted glycoside hydrolase/deacetylase ChbG (UPF0249 family)
MRCLIVNGDDFGQSSAVNDGIIEAHQKGILTSASLMVRRPAAEEAVCYTKANPNLSLGLHVDLGAWTYQDGDWVPQYEVVLLEDPSAVSRAVAEQLQLFRSLSGRNPTHLDSHQHVHKEEPARSVLLAAARQIGVPLRACTPGIRYCGGYYGQTNKGEPLPEAISVDALIDILETLPEGVTELSCHPAMGDNVGDNVYCAERQLEVNALCNPRVRNTLVSEGIELCSFMDIGNSWSSWE